MEERMEDLMDTYNIEELDAVKYIVKYYMVDNNVKNAINKLSMFKFQDYKHYLYILLNTHMDDDVKTILKDKIFYTYIDQMH